MMRLARRASLLVAFYLLISAAPATAERAWVLWAEIRQPGLRGWWNGPQWVPDSAYESREACERYTATRVDRDKSGKLVFEKDPLEGRRGLGTGWRCLPDTVDPRGPKEK